MPSLRENRYGQTVSVMIDNNPPFTLTLDAEDSENANLDVYRKSLNFKLPKAISEGEHVMRVFPVLSYGETIKKPRNFDVSTFYKGSRNRLLSKI